MKKYFWKVLWRYLVMMLMFYVVAFLLMFLMSKFEDKLVVIIVMQIVYMVFALFWSYLYLFIPCLIYKNLKAIKANENISDEELSRKAKKQIWLVVPGLILMFLIPVKAMITAINPAELIEKTEKNGDLLEFNLLQMELERYYFENGVFPKDLVEIIKNDDEIDLIMDSDGEYYQYSQTVSGKDYRLCVEANKCVNKNTRLDHISSYPEE